MDVATVDVSSPISSVIPSLDGPVLGALAGTTTPLNLTQIHRLTGRGSLAGVRLVLVRMSAAGIVTQVPGGYLLNRDHVACRAIESLAQLWSVCIDRIRATVAEWPEAPALVGIFGSAARRDGDELSDIDLLVVSNDADADHRSADLAEAVQRWTGNAAHVVTVAPADLRRMRRAREPVLDEWDRDLVVIAGSPAVLRMAN